MIPPPPPEAIAGGGAEAAARGEIRALHRHEDLLWRCPNLVSTKADTICAQTFLRAAIGGGAVACGAAGREPNHPLDAGAAVELLEGGGADEDEGAGLGRDAAAEAERAGAGAASRMGEKRELGLVHLTTIPMDYHASETSAIVLGIPLQHSWSTEEQELTTALTGHFWQLLNA